MSEEEIIKEVNMLIRFNEQDEKIAYSDFELMPNRKSYQALKGLLYLYNKEKEKNECLRDNLNHSIRTSVIKEALGLEGDITEEEILNYIDILVSENNRLEDIEDKKVQIEYQNVFNKGVKSVEKKIQEKIEEIKKDENPSLSSFQEYAQEYSINKLQELLEERN